MGQVWSRQVTCALFLFWPLGHSQLTNSSPQNKLQRLGSFTCCKLQLKPRPSVKLRKVLGNITVSRFRLKRWPRCKCWRLLGKLGKFASWSLWEKFSPKVRLTRSGGQFTKRRLWLKFWPKVKCRRLLGNKTCISSWSKSFPNVRRSSCGKVTPSKVSLKRSPKVRLCKFFGQITWAALPPSRTLGL